MLLANTAHGGNSYWYITRKSYVVYRIIISTHVFSNHADITLIVFFESLLSLAPQFSRRHIFATVFWCWNCEPKWCCNVSFTLKKKRIHEWSMRRLFIVHLFTVVKFVSYQAFVKKTYLRDLIAASGGVILIELDSNRRFFGPCDLKMWWKTSKTIGHLF